MTIQELIDRLMESGDEKFRKTATISIADVGGDLIADDLDVFNVKNSVKCVEIRLPFKSGHYGLDDSEYDDDDWN